MIPEKPENVYTFFVLTSSATKSRALWEGPSARCSKRVTLQKTMLPGPSKYPQTGASGPKLRVYRGLQ